MTKLSAVDSSQYIGITQIRRSRPKPKKPQTKKMPFGDNYSIMLDNFCVGIRLQGTLSACPLFNTPYQTPHFDLHIARLYHWFHSKTSSIRLGPPFVLRLDKLGVWFVSSYLLHHCRLSRSRQRHISFPYLLMSHKNSPLLIGSQNATILWQPFTPTGLEMETRR